MEYASNRLVAPAENLSLLLPDTCGLETTVSSQAWRRAGNVGLRLTPDGPVIHHAQAIYTSVQVCVYPVLVCPKCRVLKGQVKTQL